jgi:carbonic anhydrase/acetyltransferase-like protein (isoleucine patch superfamily)
MQDAIVHGCTIGDNSLIGMGATILDCASFVEKGKMFNEKMVKV